MTELANIALEALRGSVGGAPALSGWHGIGQSRIDAFADITDDRQFIHVDAQRAAIETPFGGTIAHGFLCLSMLSRMSYEALAPVQGQAMSMNYGFDKVRFLSPVPSGARLRGRFVLEDLDDKTPDRLRLTYGVTVDIEHQDKPALVAQWLLLVFMKQTERTTQ